jgi:hypothetical protein
MKELIEALNILLKYGNIGYPFQCEHDELMVCGYDPLLFSEEDKTRLKQLGFEIHIEGEPLDEDDSESDLCEETRIYSFKYGSC